MTVSRDDAPRQLSARTGRGAKVPARLVVGLLSAGLAVGSLSGCSGESSASTASQATAAAVAAPAASPSPTQVPAPTLPVLPEAAKQKTLAGAQAFTEYYYDLVAYGYFTYDTKPLQSVSEPNNDVTRWHTETIFGLKKDRTRLGSDIFVNSYPQRGTWVRDDAFRIELSSATLDALMVATDGSTESVSGQPEVPRRAFLRWTTRGWMMIGIENVE